VLADHSVFINEMILQADNDNLPFAFNCLEWLCGDSGQRDRVLFVEEGQVQTKFDVPLAEAPVPPIPPPGPWINDLIQGIEEENLFNRALLGQVPMRQLLRALVLALTAALLMYGMYRVGQGRHRVEPGAASLAAAVNRLAPAQPVLQQRFQDLLRSDNLRDEARTLARQCLESVGGAAPASGDRPLPQVTATGGWWQRPRVRRQVHRLWRLAYGPLPGRITAQEFAELLTEMEQVRAALAQGTLRIG
jgi:hypothetical protein